MKRFAFGFIATFTILILSSCAVQNKTPEKINREWMMVEFQNFGKDLMVKNKANLNLTEYSENKKNFSAKMGCNGMFGTANFKENQMVEFSQIGSTMMYCDKNMELEAAFAKELPKMKTYKIEGHFLTLSDSNGNKMKFIAADWD